MKPISSLWICIVINIVLIGAHPASANGNVGFVDGLWYAHTELFTKVPTRIYVAVRNNTPHELTGTIRFSDNGTRIGSMDIQALSGRLIEAWVDWTPREGEHTIRASLENGVLHKIGGETEKISLSETQVFIAEDTQFVDTDTDNDGIGDKKDSDDDNDTISDDDEIARGSDTRVANPVAQSVETDTVSTDAHKSTNEPQENSPQESLGIEQFLSPSPAKTALGAITTITHTAQNAVEEYRQERKEKTIESTPTLKGTTSVGTITREQIDDAQNESGGFMRTVSSFGGTIWDGILFLVSSILKHPAILQVSILVAILYAFFRIAAKLGRRVF